METICKRSILVEHWNTCYLYFNNDNQCFFFKIVALFETTVFTIRFDYLKYPPLLDTIYFLSFLQDIYPMYANKTTDSLKQIDESCLQCMLMHSRAYLMILYAWNYRDLSTFHCQRQYYRNNLSNISIGVTVHNRKIPFLVFLL